MLDVALTCDNCHRNTKSIYVFRKKNAKPLLLCKKCYALKTFDMRGYVLVKNQLIDKLENNAIYSVKGHTRTTTIKRVKTKWKVNYYEDSKLVDAITFETREQAKRSRNNFYKGLPYIKEKPNKNRTYVGNPQTKNKAIRVNRAKRNSVYPTYKKMRRLKQLKSYQYETYFRENIKINLDGAKPQVITLELRRDKLEHRRIEIALQNAPSKAGLIKEALLEYLDNHHLYENVGMICDELNYGVRAEKPKNHYDTYKKGLEMGSVKIKNGR